VDGRLRTGVVGSFGISMMGVGGSACLSCTGVGGFATCREKDGSIPGESGSSGVYDVF